MCEEGLSESHPIEMHYKYSFGSIVIIPINSRNDVALNQLLYISVQNPLNPQALAQPDLPALPQALFLKALCANHDSPSPVGKMS